MHAETLCPFSKGEMLSVFFIVVFFCVWFGVFRRFFTVLLFLGSLFEKVFGSEFLFLGVVVGLVFFDSVCLGFCSIFCFFAPENVFGKILFTSGLLFFGVCFFLFSRRRRRLFVFFVVFSREKA